MTVHFICRGNANRSLIAEAYLKSLNLKDINVISSGTVVDIYRAENEPRIPHIVSRLDKYGIGKYAKTYSDQLTQSRVNLGDITICMNAIVFNESNDLVFLPNNTVVWDVTDSGEGSRIIKPGEDEYKYFDDIYSEIKSNIDNLIPFR
jgi:protein-tyrosine-phosphatase